MLDNFNITTSDVIAFGALLFTLYQGYLSRQHQRVAIKPVLNIHTELTEKKGKPFSVKIMMNNLGFGAAHVTKFSITHKETGETSNTLRPLLPKELPDCDVEFYFINEGRFYMAPGQHITLMELTTENVISLEQMQEIKDAINDNMQKIETDFEYRCLLGEVQPVDTKISKEDLI